MNSSTSSNLVIGDGRFPLNLRPFRSYSERVCFGVSTVANSVLIMLLARERNPTIKPYSRVLLLNAIFDYVYTLVSIVVEMVTSRRCQRGKELELNQGTYIFVVNSGLPKTLSPNWQRVFVGLWMYAISSTCFASIVEFMFRYLHVVKNYTLGYGSVFTMGAGVALIGVHNGLLIYLAISSTEDNVATFGDRMW